MTRDSNHVEHVGVAVIVVTDVFLVQARSDSFGVPTFFMYQSATIWWPSGIDRRPQHQHDVVEDARDLRIVRLRQQVIGELQCVLRPRHFS
jgi:hypothetical protein